MFPLKHLAYVMGSTLIRSFLGPLCFLNSLARSEGWSTVMGQAGRYPVEPRNKD